MPQVLAQQPSVLKVPSDKASNIGDLLFWGCAASLVIARLWFGNLPFLVWDPTSYDDSLYIRSASEIIHGNWLGKYDELTHFKYPFFSIFLAAVHFIGLPLKLVETAAYCLACLLVAFVLRPHLRMRWILLLLFAILLFQPQVMPFRSLRITRMPLFISLALAFFACTVHVTLCPQILVRSILRWSVFAGFLLGLLLQTREEQEWLLPAIVWFALIATLRWSLLECGIRESLKRIAAYLVPTIAIPATIWLTFGTINYAYYGVFISNDQRDYPFRAAMGALQRIEHPSFSPMTLVPKEVRMQAYDVSPAFASIRNLENSISTWGAFGCKWFGYPCGDIGGAWFVSALREAAASKGHHRTAREAADFYVLIAKEINQACDTGRLKCHPFRASLAPPIQNWTFSRLPEFFSHLSITALFRLGGELTFQPGWHSEQGYRRFLDVLNSGWSVDQILKKTIEVQGWTYRRDMGRPSFQIWSSSGFKNAEATMFDSLDVASFVGDVDAGKVRFRIVSECDSNCVLIARDNTLNEISRYDLFANAEKREVNSNGILLVESIKSDYEFRASADLFMKRLRGMAAIGDTYRYWVPGGFVLAVLIVLFQAAYYRQQTLKLPLVLAAMGCLIVVLSRAMILGVFHVIWGTPVGGDSEYWSPASPFVLLFILLTACSIYFNKRSKSSAERFEYA